MSKGESKGLLSQGSGAGFGATGGSGDVAPEKGDANPRVSQGEKHHKFAAGKARNVWVDVSIAVFSAVIICVVFFVSLGDSMCSVKNSTQIVMTSVLPASN